MALDRRQMVPQHPSQDTQQDDPYEKQREPLHVWSFEGRLAARFEPGATPQHSEVWDARHQPPAACPSSRVKVTDLARAFAGLAALMSRAAITIYGPINSRLGR